MVFLVKVDDEVFAIPGGFVDIVLSRYAGRAINYHELKHALKQEIIDGSDAPQIFRVMQILDFDVMEEQNLREPVAVDHHRALYIVEDITF